MQIHVARGEQQLGVFSPEEVRARLNSGQFLPTDYGWAEGQAQWTPLSQFPGLAAVAAAGAQMASTPGGKPATSGAAVASLVRSFLLVPILLTDSRDNLRTHCPQYQAVWRRAHRRQHGTDGIDPGYPTALIPSPSGCHCPAGVRFSSSQRTEVKAPANAKVIAVGCHDAVDNEGKYQPRLMNCFKPENRRLLGAHSWVNPVGFEYYGAGTKDNDPNPETTVFLVSKALSQKKNRVVVYGDSSGKVVRGMLELPPH
jgi:hypothetical protein